MQHPAHNEYPKMMTHPHFRKSESTKLNPDLSDKRSDFQGSPERFPPVLVHNEDDEEMHAAQGYVPAGKSDPAAFARSVQNPAPPNYKPQEFPKWVDGVLVASAEHEAELAAQAAQDGKGEGPVKDDVEAENTAPVAQRERPRKVH